MGGGCCRLCAGASALSLVPLQNMNTQSREQRSRSTLALWLYARFLVGRATGGLRFQRSWPRCVTSLVQVFLWLRTRKKGARRPQGSRKRQNLRWPEKFQRPYYGTLELRHAARVVEPVLSVVAAFKVPNLSEAGSGVPAGADQTPFEGNRESQNAEMLIHVSRSPVVQPRKASLLCWEALTGPWGSFDTRSQGGACARSRNDIPERKTFFRCWSELRKSVFRSGGCGTRSRDGTTFTRVAELEPLSSSAGLHYERSEHRSVVWCLLFAALGGLLHAAPGATFTTMGNASGGTVVHVVASYDPAYYQPGGGGYATGGEWYDYQYYTRKSTDSYASYQMLLSGTGNGGTYNGVACNGITTLLGPIDTYVTVPTGQTWQFHLAGSTGHVGNFNIDTMTVVTGVSGSYVPPAGTSKLVFPIPANSSANIITWGVEKGGTILFTHVSNPGDAAFEWVVGSLPSTDTASMYTLKFWLPSLKFDTSGGSWYKATSPGTTTTRGDETLFTADATIESGDLIDESITPSPTQKVAVTAPTNLPISPVSATGTSGNVWIAAPTGSGLSDTVYKEGVDKVVNAIKATGTNEAADRAAWGTSKDGDWGGLASGKQSSAAASVNAAMGETNVSAGGTAGTSSTVFQIPLPGGIVADFAPWNVSLIHTGGLVLKAIITSFLVFGYGRWLQEEIREIMARVASAPQARGNTVVGSGGQITGLIAAAAITVVILGGPVVLTALGDNGLGWKSVHGFFAGAISVSGSVGQATLDLVGEFFPYPTAISVLISGFTARTAGLAFMCSAMIAIRWIVPCAVLVLALYGQSALAAISIRNERTEDVVVSQLGGADLVTVGASSSMTFGVAAGAAYAVTGASDGVSKNFEALDGAFVTVALDGSCSVAHPSSCWWWYLRLGFVAGCLWELGGLSFRLLSRLSGSAETV